MDKIPNFSLITLAQTLLTTFDFFEHNISILDKDLNVLWANKSYLQRLGKNFDDVINKKCYSLWHERNSPCIDCPSVKVIESGKIEKGKQLFPNRCYFNVTSIPLIENEEIKGLIEIREEIKEAEIIDKRLIEIYNIEGFNELLENIVHHLNNIFTGIYGFAQLLKNQVKDPTALSYLKKLTDSIEKGTKFIHSMVNLKKSPSIMTVFDLNYLINSQKDFIKEKAGENITVEFDLEKNVALILGDPFHIREVILELVENAIYSIEKEGKITISTEKVTSDNGSTIVLTISDNGIGMDEETLKRCFDPLFSKHPGKFGLGLSMVRNIVQMHKGSIEIKSSPKFGTTVKIYFPEAT